MMIDSNTPAPQPELAELARRIDERLSALNLSARKASLMAGLTADAIRNIHRAAKTHGRSGITFRTLNALAPVLRVSVNELWPERATHQQDTPRNDDPMGYLDPAARNAPANFTERIQLVPLKGYVGAGGEAHYYALDPDDFDHIAAPADASPTTVAVEVRGKSLGDLFDRALAFYDEVRSPVTPDLIGRLCIVGLTDGRILIKKLRSAKTPGRFDLISEEEPIRDVEVEWAARVIDVRPR